MSEMSTDPSGIPRRTFLHRAGVVGAGLAVTGVAEACGSSTGGGKGKLTGTLVYAKGPFTATPNPDIALNKKLLAPFLKKHPGLKVEVRLYDWATRQQTLTAELAGPNPPDIVYNSDSSWGLYASLGALVDLTDRIKSPSFADTYNAIPKSMWQQTAYKGRLYGIPLYASVYAIAVNKALMKNAGVTDWKSSWSALINAAKATRKGNVYGWGNSFKYGDNDGSGILGFLYANGAKIYNGDLSAGALNTPAAAQAFDFYRDLYAADVAPPVDAYNGDGLESLFGDGRIALLQDATETTLGEVLASGKGNAFPMEVIPFPAGPSGRKPAAQYSVGCLSISTKSKSQDAAWAAIEYLADKQAVTTYLKEFGGRILPLRTDVDTSTLFPPAKNYADAALKQEYVATSPYAFIPPATPLLVASVQSITPAWEKAARGTAGAKAAATANSAVNNVIAHHGQ